MVSDKRKYGRCLEERAFTLIELMVAMVVMSLGLFAIINMQVVTVRGHGYARERSQANQIALGVAEQTRKKGLEWITQRNGTAVDFNTVFPNIVLKDPPPDPAAGDNLDLADLHSLLSYSENAIASGTAFANAYRINTFGYSQEGGALPIQWAGAMFRVHYVAYYVNQPPPAAQNSLVRMTVIVSWDNKDHGEGTNWATWTAVDNFWRRHMVVVTFFLSRHQSY